MMILGGYYCGTADTSNNYTETISTTSTAIPILWAWRNCTPVCNWSEPELVVPKSWRWYDIFRVWATPKLLRPLDGIRSVILRIQERYAVGQRRKQKRRAYVQALHAS